MGHLGFDDLPLINRIFDIFDADNSSSIDYREMVCGVDLLLRGHGEETLRFCFSIYDLDDSGFIGEHELFSVLKLCARLRPPGGFLSPVPPTLTPKESLGGGPGAKKKDMKI